MLMVCTVECVCVCVCYALILARNDAPLLSICVLFGLRLFRFCHMHENRLSHFVGYEMSGRRSSCNHVYLFIFITTTRWISLALRTINIPIH